MKILSLSLSIMLIFCSCYRPPRNETSIIQAYQQYQVLQQVKKELRKKDLSANDREELIALGEQLAPKDIEMKIIKASNYKNKGEQHKAQAALEEAIELSPMSSPAFSAYGELLIANGHQEEGRALCAHAVKLNPIDIAGRNCASLH